MHSCRSSYANKRAIVAEAASNLTADAYAQLLKHLRKQESDSFAYDGERKGASCAHVYIKEKERKEKDRKKENEQKRNNKKCHPTVAFFVDRERA